MVKFIKNFLKIEFFKRKALKFQNFSGLAGGTPAASSSATEYRPTSQLTLGGV